MTNPDPAVIEIARDAIREQRASDVTGIIADQPKGQLLAELIAALGNVAIAAGVSISISPFNGVVYGTVQTSDGVDALVADFVACGAVVKVAPQQVDDGTSTWRTAEVAIAGIRLNVHGEHRNFTIAEKRKRTKDRKRKQQQLDANVRADAWGTEPQS